MPSKYPINELPLGWIERFDSRANQPFWVDTNAKPLRSIWVHPYEDEQFLDNHPDIRNYLSKQESSMTPECAPPPYSPRRDADRDSSSSSAQDYSCQTRDSAYWHVPKPDPRPRTKPRRGLIGAIKDQVINQTENSIREMGLRRQQRQRANTHGIMGDATRSPPTGYPVGYGLGGGVSEGRHHNSRRGLGGGTIGLLGGLVGGLILGEALDD